MTIESIRGSPLNICTVDEIIDEDHVIISIRGVLQYLVGVASFVDRDLLEPNCSVLVNPIVGALSPSQPVLLRRGHRSQEHEQLGGRDARGEGPRRDVRGHRRSGRADHGDQGGRFRRVSPQEAVELPLTHPELFDEIVRLV